MDFSELELSEGLRWTWNSWPSSRNAQDQIVIPLAIMCTPLSPSPDIPSLNYAPLLCKACRGALNPYARVDFHSKLWNCPFCLSRNAFPPNYHTLSENNLPAELFPSYTSVEYVLPPQTGNYVVSYPTGSSLGRGGHRKDLSGPSFLFVLDTCVSSGDLSALKDAISQSLTLLPENALVGLIAFGGHVYVHELGYSDCMKAVVFHGERELSSQRVQELLGISSKRPQRASGISQGGIGRFLVPISDCDFNFAATLEQLQPDPVEVDSEHRPQRATGAALAVAAGLMEGCIENSGARIMLFVGGPATIGPGMVVSTNLEESMRTYRDLMNNSAPYYIKASKFYKRLEESLVAKGLVLDIFACCLDQVGTHEAKSAVESSGGLMVLAETFESDQFKKSLQRLLAHDADGYLKMYFNATLEVITTDKVKVSGAIGPCSSLNIKTALVSDSQIGIGGTSMWKMCTLTDKTCIAFFFEVSSRANAVQHGTAFLIQFITKYHHCNGEIRARVTTTARRWIDASHVQDLAASFDQEAAAAIVSRLALHKAEKEDVLDVITWLDRTLIRFASMFGDYNKEVPESFFLSSNLSLFPQFMFYLRRSQFLQVSHNTPDETSFFRLMLNRESVVGTVIMIQPTLFSYSFDGPPVPVLLDISSIKPNCILLFDAYFFVVVHYGSTIAQWRKHGHHKDPSHENFKKLLEAPVLDAESLLAERNPLPKFIECDHHGSQARFLLAKLNPSVTHKSEYIGDSEVIFTDDVSCKFSLIIFRIWQ